MGTSSGWSRAACWAALALSLCGCSSGAEDAAGRPGVAPVADAAPSEAGDADGAAVEQDGAEDAPGDATGGDAADDATDAGAADVVADSGHCAAYVPCGAPSRPMSCVASDDGCSNHYVCAPCSGGEKCGGGGVAGVCGGPPPGCVDITSAGSLPPGTSCVTNPDHTRWLACPVGYSLPAGCGSPQWGIAPYCPNREAIVCANGW